MKKIILIVIILSISIVCDTVLDDVKVNGGNYGSSFRFIISGTAKEDIIGSSKNILKILIGEEEKEALCSVKNTNSGEICIYSCLLEEPILEGKPTLKKGQKNDIFQISENIIIEPLETELKYIEATNLEFNDNFWSFDLKGESEQEITPQSLIYLGIVIENSNQIAGCLMNSKNEKEYLFKCKVNIIKQNIFQKIVISKAKTADSSVTFDPELTQDENIIVFKSLNFIKGYNLLYNSDNKWEFMVDLGSQMLPCGSKSLIDITYNSISSTAICIAKSNYILKCIPDKDEQSRFDLVNINYIKSAKSTITWNDLTAIFEIPIEEELEYTRLYELTYTQLKKWNFKILLKENLLPNDALVKIDILFTLDENQNSASCYHSNSILSCVVDSSSQSASNLVQLSTIKKYGSIKWKNLKKSDKIQFFTTLTYKDSYNLDFIEDRWNFTLKADSSATIPKNSLVAINIKYGEDKKTGIANCIVNSYNGLLYECEAIYENQNENDLIIITNTTEGISTSWKSSTAKEISITRLANLNLIDRYDLKYSDKKWSFKIEVEETLPKDTKLIIDITYNNNARDTATCSYNNKILSCLRDDSTQEVQNLIRIRKEKSSGSVTWLNIKDDYVKIPFITTLSFSKSYGLFFTDVWNFMVEVISQDIAVPSGSYVIIDILQNSVEGKADCILEGGSKGKISNLTCSVIGTNQLKTDVIKINPIKKFSTVTWNLLTTTNNNIPNALNKELSLSFIDAYDMVYSNNTWIFNIIGKPTQTIWGGGIYIIDIKYITSSGIFDSTATCWTNGGTKTDNIIFTCKADYNSQTENDLVKIKYPKTDKSSITWTTGINDDYQITLKTVLTLVKVYDLYFDQVWKFKINVDNGILPPGAKVIIDIYKKKDLITTNCTSLNNKCIICDTEISSSSYTVKLAEAEEKTKKSSVEWKENLQNDYLISLKTELSLKEVNNIYFDEKDNKWKFQLTKNSGNLPDGAKIIVDILYGNSPSTATCYFVNSLINCVVDENNQEKTKLIQLSQTKTDQSTVTWTNLDEDKSFYLECLLTYEKVDNLRYENSKWLFDIYISNEDIPKFSQVKVDIYAGTFYDIAKCSVTNKKLSCMTTYSANTLIALNLYKTISSTVTWENLNPLDNRIDIIIKTSISLTSFGKIDFSNDKKYVFTCNFSGSYIPNKGQVIIDILVGNTPHTSLCLGQGNNTLLCEIKSEDYTNPFVYISRTKSDDSSITWLNLDSNKSITSIELGFYGAYNKEFVDDKFIFRILTYNNKLPNDIQVPVVVRYTENEAYSLDYEIPCISKDDILYCTIDFQNQKSTDNFQLYLPKDNSRDIKWLNGNNNYVNVYNDVKLKFLRMSSFNYDTNYKYYYFYIYIQRVNGENYSDKYIIMDVKINAENYYARCDLTNDNGNSLLYCFTKPITYNMSDEISILVNKNLGNIAWINLVNDILINDLYLGEISYMYDLCFEEEKWKFKIKLVKTETLEKQITLDISISGNRGIANCNLLNGVLSCEVAEENQTNSQVIRLNREANTGILQLSNIEEDRIPLKSSLQFNKAYNLAYNNSQNNWSFMIEAINNDNTTVIPVNSYFSIDIKYQIYTKLYNDIAYCSYNDDSNEDNIINLLCTPKNQIAKNALIMINNEKSEFTSISWIDTIPDEDLEIIFSNEYLSDQYNDKENKSDDLKEGKENISDDLKEEKENISDDLKEGKENISDDLKEEKENISDDLKEGKENMNDDVNDGDYNNSGRYLNIISLFIVILFL